MKSLLTTVAGGLVVVSLVRVGAQAPSPILVLDVRNTGNSTEPHLHFHMADRPYAIVAEGIPCSFASFGLEAAGDAVTAAVNPAAENVQVGASALALLKAPVQHRENEIPLLNAIVAFADR